jgi:hypothetical protein
MVMVTAGNGDDVLQIMKCVHGETSYSLFHQSTLLAVYLSTQNACSKL